MLSAKCDGTKQYLVRRPPGARTLDQKHLIKSILIQYPDLTPGPLLMVNSDTF